VGGNGRCSPFLTVERTVERMPGRWPLSSPCRRRRWPEGQALQGPSVPGYNRHRRTDGLPFKTTRSRQASCRALHHPFEIQKSHFSANWMLRSVPQLALSFPARLMGLVYNQ
jgi:hypothetical protein